jgi:hypothetical protein
VAQAGARLLRERARRAERGGAPQPAQHLGGQLPEARERIIQLAALDSKQEDKKGLAQQATRDRNEMRAEITAWLRDYYVAARDAFRDKPDWLERIGLLARS